MNSINESTLPIVFSTFRLEPSERRLWEGDRLIPLKPRAFDLLLYFLRRPDQLIVKDELLDEFWRDVHVGDGVLKTHVGEIRQALGDSARSHRFIETVHRHGYRFVGQIGSSPASRRAHCERPANDIARDDDACSDPDRDDTRPDDASRDDTASAHPLPPASANAARSTLRAARQRGGHCGGLWLECPDEPETPARAGQGGFVGDGAAKRAQKSL